MNKKVVILPVIGVAVFYLLPLLYSFVLSVEGITLLAGAKSFWLAMKNTCMSVICMVIPLFCISLGIALVIDRGISKSIKWLKNTVFIHMLPYIIPSTVVVFVVRYLFDKDGFVNYICRIFGATERNWLQTESLFGILLFIYLWKNYGYCMIILLGGIQKVPKETVESARLDGAGKNQILFYVILPQIRSFVLFCLIIAIANVFRLYREEYLLCGDYPHESIYSIQHYVNNCFYSMSYEKVAAVSVLLCMIFGGLIYCLYMKSFKKEEFI